MELTDFSDIRARLQRLRQRPELPLKNLTGQDLLDYQAMIRYTNMVHNTPIFPQYSAVIRDVFGNLPVYIPGTVGGYFGGCLAQTNYDNPICTPICVGSIPGPGQGNCGYKVLTAMYHPTGYEFATLNDVNSDKALIFADQFSGFTQDEKNTLARKGIKEVNISTFSADGKNYSSSSAFVPLDAVPNRETPVVNTGICTLTTPVEDDGMIVWIIFIIIAIIATFVGIAIANRRGP